MRIRRPSCSTPFIVPGGSSERGPTGMSVPRMCFPTGTCSASRRDPLPHPPSQAPLQILEAVRLLEELNHLVHLAHRARVSRLHLVRENLKPRDRVRPRLLAKNHRVLREIGV